MGNPGRKRKPPLARCPDLSKLNRMLQERKISKREMGRRIGVNDRTVGDYAFGVAYPSLPVFRALCLELKLDYFEICELLRLPVIQLPDIISFRAACKRRGTTPLQAIKDFICVYADLIPEHERQ
jgi:transcriptional regulator with XRE-family HTH domain